MDDIETIEQRLHRERRDRFRLLRGAEPPVVARPVEPESADQQLHGQRRDRIRAFVG